MNTFKITFPMIIASLLLVVSTGCASRYAQQVEQSLLLQENQRLEDALYVTHAQLVDLKRENEALKKAQGNGSGTSPTPINRARRASGGPSNADADDAPPFEPIQIEIPKDAHESKTLPDALKSTKNIPIPNRPARVKTTHNAVSNNIVSGSADLEPEPVFPVVDVGQQLPPWSPTR